MKSAKKLLTCLAVYAGCGLWISAATAQGVKLHLDWSPKRWSGFPASSGKVSSEWKNKMLYVHVVVPLNSGVKINEENPRLSVKGRKLLLCYHQQADPGLIGKPVPSAVAPVLLDFTVTGIPKRNYKIEVDSGCWQL